MASKRLIDEIVSGLVEMDGAPERKRTARSRDQLDRLLDDGADEGLEDRFDLFDDEWEMEVEPEDDRLDAPLDDDEWEMEDEASETDASETPLAARREALASRESALCARESELVRRQRELERRERLLSGQERQLHERQSAVLKEQQARRAEQAEHQRQASEVASEVGFQGRVLDL